MAGAWLSGTPSPRVTDYNSRQAPRRGAGAGGVDAEFRAGSGREAGLAAGQRKVYAGFLGLKSASKEWATP